MEKAVSRRGFSKTTDIAGARPALASTAGSTVFAGAGKAGVSAVQMLLKSLLVVFCFCVSYATAQVELAKWDFHLWVGSAGPAPQSLTAPIPADVGINVSTAKLSSSKAWVKPSAPGYVRSQECIPGDAFTLSGISTLDYSDIKVTAGLAIGETVSAHTVQLEYRTSSTASWTPVGSPAPVTIACTPPMPLIFDNVSLPSDAGNTAVLEIRFRIVAITGGRASVDHWRVDNILVSGVGGGAGVVTNYGDNSFSGSPFKVYAANNKINIQGANGLEATVYTITGIKLMRVQLHNSLQEISVPGKALYIVRIAGKAVKVIF